MSKHDEVHPSAYCKIRQLCLRFLIIAMTAELFFGSDADGSESQRPLPGTERIYLSGAGQREASALRRKAEFMGTTLRPQAVPLRSIWDPILTASRRRGY